MKYVSKVDVFSGSAETDLSRLTGIAAAWRPIRPKHGSTHPGAQLPFGRMSVCGYSGGFASGYGLRGSCYAPEGPNLYHKKCLFGLTHLHQSGTGAIGYYYNYALTTAFFGELGTPAHDIKEEAGSPGYYTVTDAVTNIKYEATVDGATARHRYTFPKSGGRISINFSHNGLRLGGKDYCHPAGEIKLTVLDGETLLAETVQEGVRLYFCVTVSGARVRIWDKYRETDTTLLIANGQHKHAFGCVFDGLGEICELKLSLSLRSADEALKFARSSTDSFDKVRKTAADIWEEKLSAIDIEADETQKEIFYSSLYHTLVKPADFSGENLYDDTHDFVTDFSTLWDIYKTQIPLLFSLYPEISRKMCNTYLTLNDKLGVMPNSFGLTADMKVEAQQARLLAAYMFCDAFWRGVEGVDFGKAVTALYNELCGDEYKSFFENGECPRTTYTLDVAESCGNIGDVASALGYDDISKRLLPFADNVKNAFDPTTGLLKEDYTYYEGTHWSYSFRPLRDNAARIAICGKEKYVELLDRFFGFTQTENGPHRFQGFNNETDMEAPYAYSLAGRHDRLCEITDKLSELFITGHDGMPGNADSGGLTACYIWNCLGLFPVSGQDLMLIGSPKVESATLKLQNGHTFKISRKGEGIYVKSAILSGRKLERLCFSVTDMMKGGELVFEMTEDKANCQMK